jgi:hypothetical protein
VKSDKLWGSPLAQNETYQGKENKKTATTIIATAKCDACLSNLQILTIKYVDLSRIRSYDHLPIKSAV